MILINCDKCGRTLATAECTDVFPQERYHFLASLKADVDSIGDINVIEYKNDPVKWFFCNDCCDKIDLDKAIVSETYEKY